MDLTFSPDNRRLAIASRQAVTLVDAETGEAVLTLRGRAQQKPNGHGFTPSVRFSPDGSRLLAVCDDSSGADNLAEWSTVRVDPRDPACSLSMRRRSVGRHLALADLAWRRDQSLSTRALFHLEQVEKVGLEAAHHYLARGDLYARADRWDNVQADLERAMALARGDDAVVARAALTYARLGRFTQAARWLGRMSSLPPAPVTGPLAESAMLLVLAHDDLLYRRHCEDLRRVFESTSNAVEQIAIAECFTLVPVPNVAADALTRIAQRGFERYLRIPNPRGHDYARFVLATAHVRAGSGSRGESLLKELFSRESNGITRARYAAWLAIALLQEHRANEAKTWFEEADRFLRARITGGRPELEQPPPEALDFWAWCRLLIPWGEAQALLTDGRFPADPFAH
jgi:tetratricopeptide (TPR) repeat protein